MTKMNWKKKFLLATLALGLIIPTGVFAAEELGQSMLELKAQVESGEITHEEAHEQMKGLRGGHGKMVNRSHSGMSEEMLELRAKVESGEITHEEAHEQMEGLRGGHGKMEGCSYSGMSEEMLELRAKVESGEITHEEAHEQMKDLQ